MDISKQSENRRDGVLEKTCSLKTLRKVLSLYVLLEMLLIMEMSLNVSILLSIKPGLVKERLKNKARARKQLKKDFLNLHPKSL